MGTLNEDGAISRRSLLVGGAGLAVAGAVAGVVAGPRVVRHFRRQSLGASVPVPAKSVPTTSLTMRSTARDRTVNVRLFVPDELAEQPRVPLCVWLHGRGDSAKTVADDLKLGHFLHDAVRRGVAPFAVVAVDGGNGYWHRHANGDDPEAMVTEELPAFLATQGIDASAWAIAGWSMGGYGSLLLAERHAKFVAVAASSAAVWFRGGDTRPGAFDSAEDFAAHDVLADLTRLPARVRIDCGIDDPFASTSSAMLRRIPNAQGKLSPGAHTMRFWRSVLPDQLAFLGASLADSLKNPTS